MCWTPDPGSDPGSAPPGPGSLPPGRGSLPQARLAVGPADAGLRADAFVWRELPRLSRTRIRQKIQGGEALLNGHRFATSTRLRAGDEVIVFLRTAPSPGVLQPPALPMTVLFEDEHLLALDKPAGMASHPMGPRQSGTVIQFACQRAAAQIKESLGRGDSGWYPRLVNRLDAATSGIILVALTREAHRALQAAVVARRMRKVYMALVEGVVAWDQGTILLPLGFDPASAVRLKMAVTPGGRASVTRVRVLRRLPRHTLVETVPETGRQHQIRVHLAAVGHPVTGDLLYPDEALFLRARAGAALDGSLPARHCLHAARVEFLHPVIGSRVVIDSPLPPDFLDQVAAAERALP
jgi:RluA family pseudouridine synthase